MSRIITTEQLAARWCTSLGYLANLRSQGKGCPYIKLGRRVVYRAVDVAKYEADRRVAVKFVRPRRVRK
ncbi:MAG TPA: hypothetical protein VMQ76_04850 [Terracidiphilus sp.]|nr:hypothetical protein [Terracidiphilus sp.]